MQIDTKNIIPVTEARSSKFKVFIFLGLFVFVCFILFPNYFSQFRKQENVNSSILNKTQKVVLNEVMSPDGLSKVISYSYPFGRRIYNYYYREYFESNIILSVLDMESKKERHIYVGNRIGTPKWLGNKHVFFTSYCKPDCQSIYLVNVLNKEQKYGIIYSVSTGGNFSKTTFNDWLDKEFVFNGLVDEIKSEVFSDKIYLVFKIKDDDGKYIGEKRFLFTENELEQANIKL